MLPDQFIFEKNTISCGIYRVVRSKSTDVSEEYIASIFREEEYDKRNTSQKTSGNHSVRAFRLLSLWCLAGLILLTLKMEVMCPSETLIDFKRATQRYIQGDNIICSHLCGELISHRNLYSR
jgi:hypothetical protein